MPAERILIVEDISIIAIDLTRRLTKSGYEVVGVADSVESAVALAEAKLPDLVLMDIRIYRDLDDGARVEDEEGGIKAAVQIRQRHGIASIFVSAYHSPDLVEKAKLAEPVGYLVKPFRDDELKVAVEVGLYKSRVDRELERQERLFSAILRSTADGIIATDSDGVIRYINPAATTLTGWHEDDARGRKLGDVFRLVSEGSEHPVDVDTADTVSGPRLFEAVSLLNRLGANIHIEGSIADIRGDRGEFEGHTLAFRDITDIKRLSETVSYQASHDALTGLINRDEFAARLHQVAEATEIDGRSHSFLFIDIDQFKVINDVCGHDAGDELLCQIAEGIVEVTPGQHILARLGGDQFGLVVLDADSDAGTSAARRLVEQLNRKFVWQNNSYNVTVSIGVAPISQGNSSVNDILAAGDDACALVKEHGGNGVETYHTADFTFLRRKGEMQWIARLTSAIDENRFNLYHQVIRGLKDETAIKYEILLRLRDRDGGIVSPGEFITAAERYKLMPSIDRWVVAAACRYVRAARRRSVAIPVICLNLSGSSLADTSLLDYLLETLDRFEVPASAFCLEVTETNAIQNFARAIVFMKRLKDEGATFALDDFGNGFSSFSYLKRLPVDYLKIDGSFVKDIETDPIDLAMLKSVHHIGHTMGIGTIAEYVHNDTIRRMIKEIGVDYAQGYAISRPLPLPDAEEYLQDDA